MIYRRLTIGSCADQERLMPARRDLLTKCLVAILVSPMSRWGLGRFHISA